VKLYNEFICSHTSDIHTQADKLTKNQRGSTYILSKYFKLVFL